MGTRKSPVLPWVDPELRRVELARLAPGELALRCLSQIDRLAEAHLGTAARREERWCARLEEKQRELQALEQARSALQSELQAAQQQMQAAQQQMQEAAKHATGLRAALLPAALREQLLAWKARLP